MNQPLITLQTPATQSHVLVPHEFASLPLSEILRRSAFALNTRCGGKGLCDGCLLQLTAGHLRRRDTDQLVAASSDFIRACEHELTGQDITLLIPPRSLLAYEPQVVSDFKSNISIANAPIWRSLVIRPSSPREAILAELSRQLDNQPIKLDQNLALPKTTEDLAADIAHVAAEYLEDGWRITAAAPTQSPIGLAIDIGTTTLALLVVDLLTGQIIASAAGFNRQLHLGDDVLTRINLCTTDASMILRLQHAVIHDTIERLLKQAAKDSSFSPERIVCATITGNATMLHLFAGVDPSPMGFAPFTAPFLNHKTMPASAVHLTGISGNTPDFTLHLLPSAAAYVGADITAGIVASGLAYDDGPSLLVDVGTNGEIVLKTPDGHLFAAATAAGPAFEGSRMASGMRAGQGAIEHLRLERLPTGMAIQYDVIGDVPPTGICGSAYVDFLAQARAIGLLTPAGRFAADVADQLLLRHPTCGTSLQIAQKPGHIPILISEADIAALLQAKAAIAAGILTLLNQIGISPADIKKLYLAGGFGLHLDINSAIACGLLPGFHPHQIELVGNTSLAGAYLALLDVSVLNEMERTARAAQIIELNLAPNFEDLYIDQLLLP